MSQDQGYPPWPPRLPRRAAPTSLLWPILALLVAVGLVVGGLFVYSSYHSWSTRGGNPNAQPRPVTSRGGLTEIEQANIRIYKENGPSVVHITTLVHQAGFATGSVPSGTGSGFIWDEEGHVVTNFHVIKDANAARVTFSDQTTYRAHYVGGAPEKDLAVLYIDAPKEKLRPILIGTSHDLQVGQFAYAIGNPFGLDQTFTRGVVSALNREIESVIEGRRITGVIQTDAAINPGNSGGPLLDSAGRLIGVNTAIYSKSGASSGIGFAIPVDEVNVVVPQLIAKGKIDKPKRTSRPGLGVVLADDTFARENGVESGAAIARVLPGSPAAKAGLVAGRLNDRNQAVFGDVIVGIEGNAVTKVQDLIELLKQYKVGDRVSVEVLRNGKRVKVPITLGSVD